MTAAAILPLAVMAGISLHALQRQQLAQAERVGVELARSVANAVDAELRNTVASLETLATSPSLDTMDLPAFRERARRILAVRPNWSGILLSDATGTPLMDTRVDPGSTPSPLAERESFDRTLKTRAPVVGSLKQHSQGGWLFAVRVPVVRGGAPRYVLTAVITPEAVRGVLTRQQLPEDWVISVIDANGLRVARSRAHDATLGGRLSESGQEVLRRGGSEGSGISYALEGERIYTIFSRLPASGWFAVLGLPTARAESAAAGALTLYGGGILLSLGLGTLAAIWVARTITGPIAQLRAAAETVGRRRIPKVSGTSIQEIRDVAAALNAAAMDLARGEAERDDLLRKERRAREAAESADRAKDEFMAVLSHELRTPLNAVYGWARMLQSGQIRDQALAEHAKSAIVRNADVQMQLIDDLLDLSRITTGKLRLETRRLQLPTVLAEAMDAVRPAADAKSIRIESAINANIPPILGDPARLQQVLGTVLMNAVKFTPAGGHVLVELRLQDSDPEIVISDSGEGIDPDVLPHVFERFRQGDSSSTRPHSGLGIGLALVKHLVELHGGTVHARSAGKGRGATFTLTLPAAPPDGAGDVESPARAVTAVAPAATARLDGVRAIVADDDAEGLVLAETILTRAGADVRTCRSAPEALDLLQQWRPDVLVSDIEMPGEDGYSLIRKVRALPVEQGGATPAIALTAYGRSQDRLRSVTAGFNMHVPKPADPGELVAIVASVVARAV